MARNTEPAGAGVHEGDDSVPDTSNMASTASGSRANKKAWVRSAGGRLHSKQASDAKCLAQGVMQGIKNEEIRWDEDHSFVPTATAATLQRSSSIAIGDGVASHVESSKSASAHAKELERQGSGGHIFSLGFAIANMSEDLTKPTQQQQVQHLVQEKSKTVVPSTPAAQVETRVGDTPTPSAHLATALGLMSGGIGDEQQQRRDRARAAFAAQKRAEAKKRAQAELALRKASEPKGTWVP